MGGVPKNSIRDFPITDSRVVNHIITQVFDLSIVFSPEV